MQFLPQEKETQSPISDEEQIQKNLEKISEKGLKKLLNKKNKKIESEEENDELIDSEDEWESIDDEEKIIEIDLNRSTKKGKKVKKSIKKDEKKRKRSPTRLTKKGHEKSMKEFQIKLLVGLFLGINYNTLCDDEIIQVLLNLVIKFYLRQWHIPYM